jgi:hypothetical protein
MKLYFKKDNTNRYIGDFETEEKAIVAIKDFCDERKYEIPYWRGWVEEDVKVFDVGSHTGFFRLEMNY